MKRFEMRYQYLGPKGIQWTNWFPYNGDTFEEIQYKSGNLILKNEYKEINN